MHGNVGIKFKRKKTQNEIQEEYTGTLKLGLPFRTEDTYGKVAT